MLAIDVTKFVDNNRDVFNQYMIWLEKIICKRGGLDQLGFGGHLKNSVLV